jgi:hypothetical protein
MTLGTYDEQTAEVPYLFSLRCEFFLELALEIGKSLSCLEYEFIISLIVRCGCIDELF